MKQPIWHQIVEGDAGISLYTINNVWKQDY
jgi:hypothetical protein